MEISSNCSDHICCVVVCLHPCLSLDQKKQACHRAAGEESCQQNSAHELCEERNPERGDAMSLTAALRGFVVVLCWFAAAQSNGDWKVTYIPTEICRNKGSSVYILSSFDYPAEINGVSTTVEKSFWFIETAAEPVDLKEDPKYKDRVTYSRDGKDSDLQISELTESDSGVYKFRLITNHENRSFTGEPGVRLTVEELQVQVISRSDHQEDSDLQLKCFNKCDPDGLERYVWFINGEETRSTSESSQMFTYNNWTSSTDRISCALSYYGMHRSPEVYPPQTASVSLIPPGEILEGSSVTLTCSSDANPAANFTWFKENKDSLKSEEQMFTISDITAEDGGLYICVAQNQLGQQNSTVRVWVGSGSVVLVAAWSIPAVLLTLMFLAVLFLKVIRRRSSEEPSVIRSQDEDAQKRGGLERDRMTSRRPAEDQVEIQYATVTLTNRQEDPLYSNIDL